MTHHLDVAPRRDLATRWRALAEQRLQYLTDLFDSGRWRRYYSETTLLENVQEARRAVEAWRALSGHPPEPPIDDAAGAVRPEDGIDVVAPPIAPKEMSLAEPDIASEKSVHSAPVDLVALERALTAPPSALDVAALEKRYPLLRHAL